MDAGSLAGLLELMGVALLATGFCLAIDGNRTDLVQPLAIAGVAALAIGIFGGLISTLAPLTGRLDQPLLPLLLDYVQETQAGRLAIVPLLPAMIAAALLGWVYKPANSLSSHLSHLAPAIIGGMLLCIPYLMAAGSHAGSSLGASGVLNQSLHITAGITWLALVLSVQPANQQGGTLAQRLQRVSNRALVVVVVIAGTGVLAAWLHGVQTQDLTTSGYGQLILFKIGLFMFALLAAAWNRFRGLRLDRTKDDGKGRLRKVLVAEALAILAILAVAALLARMMPPG